MKADDTVFSRSVGSSSPLGLLTRDYIAIQAMHGIISTYSHASSLGYPQDDKELAGIARVAYVQADAMIKESNK